jgi:c-di-GMP-binding flagellar brake protein YcgR
MSEDDRRRDFRAELRTVVNIYTEESLKATPAQAVRGWSDDISATGARLTTIDEIQGSRIWLKFVAQGQGECFIEADIVRVGKVSRSQFRSNDMLNSYGVRFLRMLSEAEFLEMSLDQVARLTAGLKTTPVAGPSPRHALARR